MPFARILLPTLAAALWLPTMTPARAAGADPLRADACVHALARLQDAEDAEAARRANDAVGAPRRGLGAELRAARTNVARRCLASAADTEPDIEPDTASGRVAQAPVAVTSPGAPTALAPLVTRAPAPSSTSTRPVPSSPPPTRPNAVLSCDSGGCWAADGTRLNRVGPVLWGARGACTVQGASLQCP